MAPGTAEEVSLKRTRKRRQLSCLPCRQHKLKCDRRVPCDSCVRYRRDGQCSQHPSPETRTWTRWTYTRLAQATMDPHRSTQSPRIRPRQDLRPPSATGDTQNSTGDELVLDGGGVYHDSMTNSPEASPVIRVPSGRPDEGPATSVLPLPLYLSQPSISVLNAIISQPAPDPLQTESFWKSHLISLLPTQNQCDMLVAFYMENINWLYNAVHVPLFRQRYYQFWTASADDADLIWLSLLFTMISLSALYISPDLAEAAGFEPGTIRRLAHTWHGASRQALFSGGFESRPRLLQLATFLATQLYWLSTKNGEAMNSCLGQAVRNAQALHLDRDRAAPPLKTQLRRRAWWELSCCDTFQSLCFGRAPLISAAATARVPLPANVDDATVATDAAAAACTPRPDSEPTDMSAKIARAEVFRIYHKLYADDGAHMSSWEYVSAVDAEVQAWLARLPWFFRAEAWHDEDAGRQQLVPSRQPAQRQQRPGSSRGQRPVNIQWSHHVLHSSVCMQRIRMARPFLGAQHAPHIRNQAHGICLQAAHSILDAYKRLRPGRRTSPRFHVQSYQSYSSAVQLAAFLLVEPTFETEEPTIRQDIEMVIEDLSLLADSGPMTADGQRVLRIMLQICDMRRLGGGQCQAGPVPHEEIATEIAPVFGGGENTARKYLRRCDINYLLNQDLCNTGMSEGGTFADSDMAGLLDFDAAVDMLGVEHWDFLLQDTNFVIGSL